MSRRDEFGLIHWITENRQAAVRGIQQGDGPVRVGIGDDAAVVRHPQGMDLVLTCDTMVDGIHFANSTMSPSDVGYKAMSAALSDLAAMGATAQTAMVSAAVPKTFSDEQVKALFDGLEQSALDHQTFIVGGDTVATAGPLTVTVSVTGAVPPDQAILRSGAKAGDVLFITGDLGLSAAGLEWMHKRPDLPVKPSIAEELTILKEQHRRPRAQLKAGELLRESGVVHALNDISDGLVSECWEIAEASGKSVTLFEELIPVHPALVRFGLLTEQTPLTWVLYGGEDYQLVGTAPATELPGLQIKLYEHGIYLTMIGVVMDPARGKKPEVELMWNNEQKALLKKAGYNHFGGEQP